jgi:hypothetical protein
VAVGDAASVVEGVEVERPDLHDFLEPLQFFVGETDMPAVCPVSRRVARLCPKLLTLNRQKLIYAADGGWFV